MKKVSDSFFLLIFGVQNYDFLRDVERFYPDIFEALGLMILSNVDKMVTLPGNNYVFKIVKTVTILALIRCSVRLFLHFYRYNLFSFIKMSPFKEIDHPIDYNLSGIALKSGFKFRDIENRRLDWKTLGCVDVNKVIENQDFEFLEKITPKIIEAPMQTILNSAALDPAVSTLFRLAQMSLQYLSFCQQFMSHTLYDLRTAFNLLQRVSHFIKSPMLSFSPS